MRPPLPERPSAASSPTALPPVDAAVFRDLMSRFATGVTVVTARHMDRDVGMTVNAFLSVSLEPPTVLVSLNRNADTTPVVQRSGRFGLTVLSSAQRHLSDLFASRIPSYEKFQGVPFHRGPLGHAWLDGGLSSLECEVVHSFAYATHLLFLGRVVAQEHGSGAHGLPLVFWRGGYARPSQADHLVMTSRGPSRGPPRPTGPRGSPAPRRKRRNP